MANKKNKKQEVVYRDFNSRVHPDVVKSIWVIIFLGVAILLILAGVGQAGPLGREFSQLFEKLFGWGYWFLPVVSFLLGFSFIPKEKTIFFGATVIGGLLFILSGLGFLDIIASGKGGLTGNIVGALEMPFGMPASLVITTLTLIASFLLMLNRPLNLLKLLRRPKSPIASIPTLEVKIPPEPQIQSQNEPLNGASQTKSPTEEIVNVVELDKKPVMKAKPVSIKNYIPPPLNLLISSVEKPTTHDLRANANIIKRTLESFGVPVEMGEVSVGPTVTRYTLKPAEGIKLSRITALNQDLALALAAHPIRIEAPIPGKSLVGIEVPNKAAALVRLGSLLQYPEFQKSGELSFVLGRNVNGEPIFADIGKMPHLLIAGATGSGKSIMMHCLINALLYKNSPEMLKLILIDPKRVELSNYEGIPHLMGSVITDNKKSIGALRWAIQEMERRYELLLEAGARDIKGYNQTQQKLPYLLIVIDELADLMTSFGREVEGSIIRLAQMSRATGLHLIVSTQRPSVEVITGLIKANITSRIALQVASQVDSRTILDTAGAEKLLGSGDLLFVSSEMSKPRRIQGAFITEDEIKKVVSFIKKNNEAVSNESLTEEIEPNTPVPLFDLAESDDDELYEKAVEVVRAAKKASASLLQRRLKLGYARAARLLDTMEERGVVGPGEGARPREVY